MKSIKRITSFAILSIVALTLSITSGIIHNHEQEQAVFADGNNHDHSQMTPWTSNNSLPSSGSYYLDTDVTISSTLNVSSTLDLCLNGHGIRMSGTGCVIKVGEGATLKLYDCDTTTEHRYSISNPAANGAGVATVNDSLTSNYETFTGGYITGGSLYGGYQYGAGINLEGNGATLYMYGGTIIGNRLTAGSTGGGGVCVQDWDKSGGFYMYGGSIIGNTSNYGGGVYVRSGKMEMFDGNISKNVANGNIGGAVLVFGENLLDIKGGSVNNNTAVYGGAFEASGGGTITISGGSFTNNLATGKGGALTNQRTDGDNSPATFNISGAPVFSGNTAAGSADDVYLCNTATLNLTEAMTNTTKITVAKASTTGDFTSNWSTHMAGKDPADYFASANSNNTIVKSGSEASIVSSSSLVASVVKGEKTSNYADFSTAVSDWADGTTLKLLKDTNNQLSVSSGTKTLDLNNHSLTYTSGSVVIVTGGTLTICDNSASKTKHYYTLNQTGVATLSDSATDYYFEGGYITGGNATEQRGGGLRVLDQGSVVFSSGTIFANKAGWGGGIWSNGSGSVTIEGSAAIIGNYSSGNYTSGGGYFMEGSCAVTMTGGSIRHNSSQYAGGGVRDCIQESTGVRFTMIGGEITGNYSNNNQGSGFCFDMATTFNIGGSARIINNQGSNDIYIYNNRYLTITSAFTEEAKIGVTLQNGTGSFTSGWSTYMKEGNPQDYFVSNEGYDVFVKNNELIITDHIHSWAYVANGNVITATCEVDNCTVLTNPTLTIDAEGKTYDGSAVIATLTPSEDWTEENGLSTPEIVYSGNTNVGTYTASITMGDATASATFIITPATDTDVEIIGGNMTIDGIDEEIDAIIKKNPTANNVSLAVKLEEKTEQTATSGDEIADYTENKVLSFFDITLELTLDSVTTELKETDTVLEIGISYAKVNKRDLVVYSYHDNQVRTFQESNTKQDGTFRVDKENAMVYIYTKTFSTYAIGYTPYYRLSVDLSFGAFDGKINITLEDKNGEVVYKLEGVDANNVVFNDVPMGQYKAIISWADEGITTSLAFNLTIGPNGVTITPIQNA